MAGEQSLAARHFAIVGSGAEPGLHAVASAEHLLLLQAGTELLVSRDNARQRTVISRMCPGASPCARIAVERTRTFKSGFSGTGA
jgi:hypothetical protein